MTLDQGYRTTASEAASRPAARHKWFPIVCLIAAGIFWWWIGRSQYSDDYKNIFRTATAGATAMALSVWLVGWGPYRRRVRWLMVAGPWLAVGVLLVLFRPVLSGDMSISGWQWRFAPAVDETLQLDSAERAADDWQTTPHDYPRFLGNGYWAEVTGVELDTDWQHRPPEQVWRREIGAGWSAFAVVGNYALTQEQRGEHELVTCYRVDDGELVWTHRDRVRFDPPGPNAVFAGAGPRATPTIVADRVFTQGATGVVNCLDARTGQRLWSQDTVAEHGVRLPSWGKSNSPLVVDDVVVISVGAPGDRAAREEFNSSLVAYDIETGEVRWAAGHRQASYASPIVATLAGERQVISVNQRYVTAHRAADGEVLWEHPWADAGDRSESASQPVPLDGDRVFLSKGYGVGASLVEVVRQSGGHFDVRPLWDPPIKPVMKTKFTNVVVRHGYAYGLDDVLLSCIELETGDVRWKKRRRPSYGHGQVLLVGEVLLVLTEQGELVAVEASPHHYNELASVQVLDDANRTWNNPAFAPPFLLVRNGREAACYRLPLK